MYVGNLLSTQVPWLEHTYVHTLHSVPSSCTYTRSTSTDSKYVPLIKSTDLVCPSKYILTKQVGLYFDICTVWTESFARQNFFESLYFANFATKSFVFLMPITLIDCHTITSSGVHK